MLPIPVFTTIAPTDALFRDLLEVSLTGVILYTPIYGEAGEIADFRFVYLNPTAQRMMRMPEQPTLTHREQWPQSKAHGTFAFHVDAFVTGEPRLYEINYQADGYDNYYRLAARRSGQGLLVSFTDTADQPRTAVEVALRANQARDKVTRAEIETQRERLHGLLMQLPAIMATYRGPTLVYELVSPPFQQLFPARHLPGRPIREALPELADQGIYELLDRVYQTGEAYYGLELPTQVDYTNTGRLEQRYHNMYFQATRDAHGAIDGLISFAYDVTEQVVARQQVQQLNEELEARVQRRTQEAEAARAEAEEQRNRLERLFSQAPALINLFTGPDHVLTLVHPGTTHLLPNRPLLGLPRRVALPELPEDQHEPLDRVYRTGEPVHAYEVLRRLDRFNDGNLHDMYFDLTFQPMYDAAGQREGVMSFVVDVTERVHNRHRAEALQAEVLAAALRQAREREAFHEVFEQTPALIALLRAPGHRFEYVNPAYQQLFPGRTLVGRDFAEAMPEAQGFGASMDRVYETGKTFIGAEIPFVVKLPDGQSATTYYNFTHQAYREDGQIVGISIFAFDVTGQVLARQQNEALQAQVLAAAQRQAEARALLYQVFEETPALICILRGPVHRYEYYNAAYQRQYGERELAGCTVADALPEAAAQGFVVLLDRVYQTGEMYFGQELLLTLEQSSGAAPQADYYNLTYQAYREDGQIVGVCVFAYVVTEQVRARQEREAQQQQLQRLFMQAPAAVSILAGSGLVYELVNPVYEGLFPGRELRGRAIAEALPELAGTGVIETFQQVYRTGITNEEKESLIPVTNPENGQLEDRYFNYIQQARRDAQGHIDGVLVFAFEVTEQVRARQSSEASARQARVLADGLGHSNEQLTRTNTDLDNFIYTASHDLRAPIANIEGLLDALQSELPARSQTDEVAHILALMQGSVDRFTRTIEHLTDVSKLQKEHEQPTEAVPLAAVIENVCLDLAPLLRETGGQLYVDVRDTVAVTFSEKNLRSVVYNLLSNALKYHHPDRAPEVRVRPRPEDAYLVLELQD
ncbi:MAG: PAS domain-containing protein, partial [Hymenobacteraceae bacterium]|nr:PAS domain-containing protein [Hymenobacteraceae bacterium]